MSGNVYMCGMSVALLSYNLLQSVYVPIVSLLYTVCERITIKLKLFVSSDEQSLSKN